jgi:hypothetical protein
MWMCISKRLKHGFVTTKRSSLRYYHVVSRMDGWLHVVSTTWEGPC